jgi:C-terminal processing protease CtpA/Prc
MGAEQSNLASEAEYAFHVLRIDENSPAAVAKLVPFFDYIVSVNGVKVVLGIWNVIECHRSRRRQTWLLKWLKTIWTGR